MNSKLKLGCIFNYAPLYRKSIFQKIDEEFDTQFFFTDMVSDIEKIDYSNFKRYPITIKDKLILGKLPWRKGILSLPFNKYDAFLVLGDFTFSYIPFIILSHLLGKKVYGWGHGRKSFKGYFGFLVKWLYQHYDGYFTYGEKGRKRLIELGISSNRLNVIYNSLNEGVNLEEQHTYKSDVIERLFKNNLFTILFIGRLTKIKQLDWIVKAQSVHKSKGINYNVLLIGDGTERMSLEKLVKKHGLSENFYFYGACHSENVLSSLIYNVDLCVSPGNVGLTALHAMCYGTPVLSNDDFETQMPEYETIIEGKTGLLYKKGDFMDFCNKIEMWLNLDISREIIRQNCYDMINGRFNSSYQIYLLKQVIK